MRWIFSVTILLSTVLAAKAEIRQMIGATDSSIRFEQGLNWQQVLNKAKAENKYIFVDCYATWCVPCKKMDNEVYPEQGVRRTYDSNFICVKMQMDKSSNDDETTRGLYTDAKFITERYKVAAYPTFLFFTPDGKLLRTSTGAMESGDFIKLAVDVLNPEHNYYDLLRKYKEGNRNMSDMSYLARAGMALGDTVQAMEVAKQYLHYLNGTARLTEENILFMAEFTKTTRDPGFNLFYKSADKVNKIIGNGDFAQGIVADRIAKETVYQEMKKANESTGTVPDWENIEANISKRYNNYYAKRVIRVAMPTWEAERKDWKLWSKYYVLYEETYVNHTDSGHWAAFHYNNAAWTVFYFSDDKEALKRALLWSERAVMIDPDPNWMDTYANILYKLGRIKLAIRWEEVAVKSDPNDKGLQAMLGRMKEGEPTWGLQ